MPRTLLALSLLALCTACATGVTHVQLADPQANLAPEPAATVVQLTGVRDARPDTTFVGVKKNSRLREVGAAALEGDAALTDVLTAHLTAAFARHGFELREASGGDAPQVEVEIRRFWAEFGPSVFTRYGDAEVELYLRATPGFDGQPWSQVFSGSAEESSQGGAKSLLTASLNAAYAEALGQLEAELARGSLRDLLNADR